MFISYICLFTHQVTCISQNILSYNTIVQEKDNYIAQLTRKLHKKDETITTLQKQLEQYNQQLRSYQKTTGTSYYCN